MCSSDLIHLVRGSTVIIDSGAPMPQGADAVVPWTATDRGTSRVEVRARVESGANVRRRGEDVTAGTTVLPKGSRISARQIALLAGLGRHRVNVHPAPRCRILPFAPGKRRVALRDHRPGRTRLQHGPAPTCPCSMIVRSRPHWLRMLFVLRGSILPTISPQLIIITLFATLVTALHGQILDWKVSLNFVPFSLIGVSLAIFLGFRNSTSYARYWEARTLWGQVLAATRSLGRQAQIGRAHV